MQRLVSSLQFRLIAGFAILLALAITSVSAFSAANARHQTKVFAAEVEAARTERAERLVENAFQASRNWAEVQLVVAQMGGLLGWRVVVTDTDGYVVADSHELVVTARIEPDHFGKSWQRPDSMIRRKLTIGDQIVGEMLMDPYSSYHRPALSVSDFGAELFEAYGFPVQEDSGFSNIPESPFFPRSSLDGRIPAERLSGTRQSTAAATQDALDELLIEPPLTDLEASFRRSLIIAGVAGMTAGLIFITFFARQALAPVRGLTSAARQLGSGDLTYRVPETRQDEIGELARTFNEMATDLESAELQRRRMTADIAHELRTPLTNIQGYLEAILDGVVQPDAETITNLHSQTVHLSHLVDDLRVLAIAEAGALRLETAPDSLESVAKETVASFQPRAAELGIELTVSSEPGLPLVELDRTRMRQVIVNLIENALHHTLRDGCVGVGLATQGKNEVVMTVTDTGRGIPEEEIPRIFDQFYRVDPSRARTTGGAGLGLTIVKRFVEAHEGQITVESVQGQGTTFHVTLPAAAEAITNGGED